jgi:hypothetical protein
MIITPPCDYKPLDQSASDGVRTGLMPDGVLNLVYLILSTVRSHRNSQPAGLYPSRWFF